MLRKIRKQAAWQGVAKLLAGFQIQTSLTHVGVAVLADCQELRKAATQDWTYLTPGESMCLMGGK